MKRAAAFPSVTLADLAVMRLPPPNISPWELDADALELRLVGRGVGYSVDLRRCLTSAAVLDWVVQVAKKTWATDDIVAQLVRALAWALDAQGTLCSFGANGAPGGKLSPDDVRRLVRRAAEETA